MPPPDGAPDAADEDPGYMYLALGPPDADVDADGAAPLSAEARVLAAFGPDRHVFWPADGF